MSMKKYVDMRGVIEVRTVYDNPEDEGQGGPDDLPVDLYHFQEEYEYLPENFCAKDKYNGVQKIFWCLVCDCDMKSLVSMDSHVSGTKHHKKVVELKRVRQGLPPSNPIEKKKVKPKKPNVRADISLYLRERLEKDYFNNACLGLEYITEHVSKEMPASHPMYTCSLPGCKSAWGDSDSMANHLCGNKQKHNKNYIMYHMKDPRGACLTKDQVMDISEEEDNKLRQSNGERDYKKMKRESNHKLYMELKDRPADWSEAKQMAGVEMGRGGGRGGGQKRPHQDFRNAHNSNYEPLGSKKVPRMDSSRDRNRNPSPPPRAPPPRSRSPPRPWYKDVNFEERAHNHMGNLVSSRDRIYVNLKKIERERRNDLREVTAKAMDNLKLCIKIFPSSPNFKYVRDDFYEIEESVRILDKRYEAVMKADLEGLQRLRNEVENLDKELKSGKVNYRNHRERIANVLLELDGLKADEGEAKVDAETLRAKCHHLEKTVGKLSAESDSEEQEQCKRAFKAALEKFIRGQFIAVFRNDPRQLEENVAKYLNLIYDKEVEKHAKSERPWKDLRLGTMIGQNVGNFLKKRMESMAQQIIYNRVE